MVSQFERWTFLPPSIAALSNPRRNVGLGARTAWSAGSRKRSNDDRNMGLGPNHDWSSHGADVSAYVCIHYDQPEGVPPSAGAIPRPAPARAAAALGKARHCCACKLQSAQSFQIAGQKFNSACIGLSVVVNIDQRTNFKGSKIFRSAAIPPFQERSASWNGAVSNKLCR